MITFIVRRLLLTIPTLLVISLVIFLLLELAPGDPMAQVPLTVPPEVKEKMREALGLGQPVHVRYVKWLYQFFVVEPSLMIDWLTRDSFLLGWMPDTSLYNGDLRVISWQTRSPVMDIVVQRLPQTLWVVGMGYLFGVLIALPIGIWNSIFDIGRVAVGASTAVALVFVIMLAARTRTSTVVAVAIIALSILFTLFIFIADYMAWMVAAKGLFAFTPRMLSLDYCYLALTLVILAAGHFVSGYLGSGVYALALLVTLVFLAVAARRWRSIERLVEA